VTAPDTRFVDQFRGELADHPSKFWEANQGANEHLRDYERLRDENAELLCRVQELQAEDDAKAATIGQLKAEVDQLADLAERLDSLGEAHQITLGLLAEANRKCARLESERDSWRAAASAARRES
jgi:chromosome segregation ATPase